MIEIRKFTEEEITSILEALRQKYPKLTFDLSIYDKRFIRVSEKLGEQRVDTIPISLIRVEYIHLVEAEILILK